MESTITDTDRLNWLISKEISVSHPRQYGHGVTIFHAAVDVEERESDLRLQIDRQIIAEKQGE